MSKRTISLENKTILVTGCPGFIGAALVKRLLSTMKSGRVVAIDSMNDYYDPALKKERLRGLMLTEKSPDVRFEFYLGDIANREMIDTLFRENKFDIVVNLAAQAGVRYSILNPDQYIASNICGFFNILEACRHSREYSDGVQHLVYASSSSVYGGSKEVPFRTDSDTSAPVSLYAATKKSNELMAHAYAKLYDIPMTGLRFFTVYGPAGRPDMFYYTAAEKLSRGEKIKVFNYGDMQRDFTYIDDIVEGIIRVMQNAPEQKRGADGLPIPPHALYNIGGGRPENLLNFIRTLSEELIKSGVLPESFDIERNMEMVPMQPGDVTKTFADTEDIERDFGFIPKTDIREGLHEFAVWYASRKPRDNAEKY